MKYSRVFVGLALLLIGPAAAGQSRPAQDIDPAAREKLDRVSLRIDILEVDISQRGQLLWRGTVGVNRMNRAIRTIEGEDAAGAKCRPMGFHSNSHRITLNIMKWGGNITDRDKYSIDATLERSDLPADCSANIASGARITKDVVRIRRGQTIALSGENGFHVTILRRR